MRRNKAMPLSCGAKLACKHLQSRHGFSGLGVGLRLAVPVCLQVLAQNPGQSSQHYVLPMPKWPVRESALLKRLAVSGPHGKHVSAWVMFLIVPRNHHVAGTLSHCRHHTAGTCYKQESKVWQT
jgi:hypothetical protein